MPIFHKDETVDFCHILPSPRTGFQGTYRDYGIHICCLIEGRELSTMTNTAKI